MAEKFVLCIWTDGSHIKGTTIMGYGAFARYADVTAELACRVRGGAGYSNPTLELLAAWRVVRILLARGTDLAARFSHVEIFSDYIGVAKYANGEWSAARASTKTAAFRSTALRWEKALRELRGLLPVSVAWVRGHSGNAGNDRADELARSATECNTFARLFDP